VQQLSGQSFGKYEVIRPIGSGGMAQLFLCRTRGIGGFEKQTVIKVLHPKYLEEEQYVQMFLDEARITASLNHPNLVAVYEVDALDDVPYLAMEFVNGPTLNRLISRAEKLQDENLGCVARILSDVCQGLHYAHNANAADGNPMELIHRDVSLSNIIISESGITKVIDFGVAKAADKLSRTEVGTLKGKLHYMAPEQLRGQDFDHRVDVYAAGVCLYRCALGAMPFPAENAPDLIMQRTQNKIIPPKEVDAEFPDELERIILKALATKPRERYLTAQDLADDLDAFASERGAETRAVASWIQECFPKGEEGWRPPMRAGVMSESKDLVRRLSTAELKSVPMEVSQSHTMMTMAENKVGATAVVVIALFMFSLVGLGAYGLYILNRAVDQTDGVATTEGLPDDNVSATLYLDEAERQVAQTHFSQAVDLLSKVEALNVTDPAVDIRYMGLATRVKRTALLTAGQRALAAGDLDGAAEKAGVLLDDDGNDQDALDLLAGVGAAREAKLDAEEAAIATAEEQARPAGAPVRRRAAPVRHYGNVEIVSPLGGTVYIDDARKGDASSGPIRLRTGSHSVIVRLDGHEPFRGNVTVREGQTASVQVDLVETAPAEAAPTVDLSDVSAIAATLDAAPAPAPVVAEPAPEPVITDAVADVDTEAAVVAPAPAPQAPAPVAHRLTDPSLPANVQVRSMSEVPGVFANIESQLVAGGFPASSVRGITTSLAQSIAGTYTPGQAIDVYPRGTYAYIAAKLDAGESPQSVKTGLVRAQQRGRLR